MWEGIKIGMPASVETRGLVGTPSAKPALPLLKVQPKHVGPTVHNKGISAGK